MITVRVVSAPITLMRWKTEEDFGQTAATVSFICLKLLFLHISVIFAVDSRHWLFHFVPTYLLIWMTCLLAEGFCAKGFYDYKAGFLWLDLLFACWRLFLFLCLFSLFVFFSHLLKRLLFWAWASVNHSFFTPWCFFSPLLSIMLLPLFLQCILGTRKWSQMPRMR